jgi:hypothetical protein
MSLSKRVFEKSICLLARRLKPQLHRQNLSPQVTKTLSEAESAKVDIVCIVAVLTLGRFRNLEQPN